MTDNCHYLACSLSLSPHHQEPEIARNLKLPSPLPPHTFNHDHYRVRPGKKLNLAKFPTRCDVDDFKKDDAVAALANDRDRLADAQRILYASGTRSLLIIFQAMDAAGKDGTIRHVMSGVNPQGCSVTSFKAPTDLETSHHFLWRAMPYLPAKGDISIFNRSYYEETLVVRIHPAWLKRQMLPEEVLDSQFLTPNGIARGGPPKEFWQSRFESICGFEKHLADSGTEILKFYLHVSKNEQRERFLERIENPEKHWKFNSADIAERQHWAEYRSAYEAMLPETSRKHAPWYVIPADQKWFMRSLVADIITEKIREMDLTYPVLEKSEREKLRESAELLANEEE